MLQFEQICAITNRTKIGVSRQVLIHDEADSFNPAAATNRNQFPITARHQMRVVGMRLLGHRPFIKRTGRDIHRGGTRKTRKFSDRRF